MKVVVVNEVSTKNKNPDVLAALRALTIDDFDIINAGMTENKGEPELNYIHTGFLGSLLLNLGRADFIVGGCGTGQGFANAIMQYPNVTCGFIKTPLDAWLFRRINGGNAISLPLNQGYGWAGEVNLRFIFEKLFTNETVHSYPVHRSTAQAEARNMLKKINMGSHYPFYKIVANLADEVLLPVLKFPNACDLVDIDSIEDDKLRQVLRRRIT